MDTRTINKAELKSKVVVEALESIDSIMKEFDEKIFNVYSMLEKALDEVPVGDEETSNIIDEIMARLIDDLPDRVDFMNGLWGTAIDITINADDEEEDYEESTEEDYEESTEEDYEESTEEDYEEEDIEVD